MPASDAKASPKVETGISGLRVVVAKTWVEEGDTRPRIAFRMTYQGQKIGGIVGSCIAEADCKSLKPGDELKVSK